MASLVPGQINRSSFYRSPFLPVAPSGLDSCWWIDSMGLRRMATTCRRVAAKLLTQFPFAPITNPAHRLPTLPTDYQPCPPIPNQPPPKNLAPFNWLLLAHRSPNLPETGPKPAFAFSLLKKFPFGFFEPTTTKCTATGGFTPICRIFERIW